MRSLGRTLTLSVVLSISVLVFLLGVYFNTFLKTSYLESASQRVVSAFGKIATDYDAMRGQLVKSLTFFETDKYLTSSIELINNYQDKNHYNAILLDEEKKNIAHQLLDRVKLSMNQDIALYDKNGDLVSYVIKTNEGYKLHFISYEKGNQLLYTKLEFEESYRLVPLSEHLLVTLKHKDFYEKTIDETVVTLHYLDKSLNVKAHKSVFYPQSESVQAHIEMTNVFDKAYIETISENLGIDISMSDDPNYAPLSVNLEESGFEKKLKILPIEQIYMSVVSLQTIDAPLYFVAKLDTLFLQKWLDQSRQEMIAIFVVLTLLTLMLLRQFFQRRLTQPLLHLTQQINKIEHQDYTPSNTVSTKDEFELISKNINQLAQVISTRENDLKTSQTQLEMLSNHDTLTELFNRRFFMQKLDQTIEQARQKGTSCAVLFLDLDQFKQVNDTLGHNIGDLLLQEVAKRISQTLRDEDTLARIGGDEFNILIENFENVHALEVIAEKLLADFKVPFVCQDHEIFTTASIGVTIYPKDGKDGYSLIKNADLAMYKAKEKGRNQYQFFTQQLAQSIEERTELYNALKQGLETFDEFFLLYQPKISAKTQTVSGIEVLVRWNSAKLGFMEPAHFIHLAEETNLIIPLGEWITRKACQDFLKLQKKGYAIGHVSINISTVQMLNSDLVKTMRNIIDEVHINPRYVELEITESFIATNEQRALQTLKELRAMKFDLAIDDFGTGYSSMGYLQKLPVTRLKIDKSFVDNVVTSEGDAMIVRTIINLAKIFKLEITAEGVETQEQAQMLIAEGCDECQGYYYAKPLSMEDLERYLDAHKAK